MFLVILIVSWPLAAPNNTKHISESVSVFLGHFGPTVHISELVSVFYLFIIISASQTGSRGEQANVQIAEVRMSRRRWKTDDDAHVEGDAVTFSDAFNDCDAKDGDDSHIYLRSQQVVALCLPF